MEDEYVFVFLHPDLKETSQLPCAQKYEKRDLSRHLMTLVRWIFLVVW